MSKSNGAAGFSLIELLVVVAVMGIIASLAIPSLLASRRAANEGSALSSLRTIHSSQAVYYATAGNGGYGTTTELLNQNLIDAVVGGSTPKSGYNLTITPDNTGSPKNYFSSGVPADTGSVTRTGTRSFSIAEDGILRGKVADAGPANHTEALDFGLWPAIDN